MKQAAILLLVAIVVLASPALAKVPEPPIDGATVKKYIVDVNSFPVNDLHDWKLIDKVYCRGKLYIAYYQPQTDAPLELVISDYYHIHILHSYGNWSRVLALNESYGYDIGVRPGWLGESGRLDATFSTIYVAYRCGDVSRPAAHLPSSDALVVAAGAGLGLALFFIVFSSPRRR